MNNWELVKEEIGREDLIIQEKEPKISSADSYCMAMIIIANKYGADAESIDQAINWLTQEAESEEPTLKEKIEKKAEKKDLFPMLSAEEKAYNQGKADGYVERMKEEAENEDKFIAKVDEHGNIEDIKLIPQQSEARFMWAGDILINTNLIDHISFNTDGTPVFYTIGGAVKHTDKETLKQLGIEVV